MEQITANKALCLYSRRAKFGGVEAVEAWTYNDAALVRATRARTSEKVPVSLFSRVDFPTDGKPARHHQHFSVTYSPYILHRLDHRFRAEQH